MNGRQFIYHMQGLSKTYPGNRKVLVHKKELVLLAWSIEGEPPVLEAFVAELEN